MGDEDTIMDLQEQWDNELSSAEEGVDFHPATEEAAKAMYLVSNMEKQVNRIKEVALSQRVAVNYWEDREIGKLRERANWFVRGLEWFLRGSGRKTISLPNGTIKIRAQQPKITVDEEAFFSASPDKSLLRVIPEQIAPDIMAIKAHIKDSGEIPEGVTVEDAGEPKFSYTVE